MISLCVCVGGSRSLKTGKGNDRVSGDLEMFLFLDLSVTCISIFTF